MVWPVDLMAFVEVSCSSDQSGDLMQMDPKIPNSAWFIIIPGSEQHSSTTRQDRPVSGPRSHPPRGASGGLRRRASDTGRSDDGTDAGSPRGWPCGPSGGDFAASFRDRSRLRARGASPPNGLYQSRIGTQRSAHLLRGRLPEYSGRPGHRSPTPGGENQGIRCSRAAV